MQDRSLRASSPHCSHEFHLIGSNWYWNYNQGSNFMVWQSLQTNAQKTIMDQQYNGNFNPLFRIFYISTINHCIWCSHSSNYIHFVVQCVQVLHQRKSHYYGSHTSLLAAQMDLNHCFFSRGVWLEKSNRHKVWHVMGGWRHEPIVWSRSMHW